MCHWHHIWQSTLLTAWELDTVQILLVCLMYISLKVKKRSALTHDLCRLISLCVFLMWFSTPQADTDFVTCVFTLFSAEQLSLLCFMVAKGTTDSSYMMNVQLFMCSLLLWIADVFHWDFTFLQDRNHFTCRCTDCSIYS